MQFTTLFATAILAAAGLAAPSNEARPTEVHLQWQGAAGVKVDQKVLADGQTFNVNTEISVSHIQAFGPESLVCHANGIDGSKTDVFGFNTVDVGPPQVQSNVTCTV
ncbi:hypothetical protein JX265_005483 [Neoarthrinium moseri]|uniref:Uncharacterized protein n=1 Tax=Neoarthrinium moseri TaxID=1658444 RepID=A0A9P9WNY4_9PEZI|nr:hypothetical protein JX266_008636 [Neoarthrinium moseri]KAI1872603.1 hypothetical protein JX265_005483 [Neoarthrinium moseri]